MNDVISRVTVYASFLLVSTALSSNDSIHVTHHCKLKYVQRRYCQDFDVF